MPAFSEVDIGDVFPPLLHFSRKHFAAVEKRFKIDFIDYSCKELIKFLAFSSFIIFIAFYLEILISVIFH